MRSCISIRAMMGLVLLVALGVAALRSASEVWASLAFTATLGLLGVAALGAMFRRGPTRAFHAGVAVFGLSYMLLAFAPWTIANIRPRLLTSRLLDAAYPVVHPASGSAVRVWNTSTGRRFHGVAFTPDGQSLAIPGSSWRMFVGPGASPASFQDIGHAITALLAALIGGLVARGLHDVGDRDT